MTHPNNPDLLNTVLQVLTTQGTPGLAEGLRLLLNEAMRQERSAVLQAQPYERSEERLGHANGFKPKPLATRVGQIDLRVPQVRNVVDFYPSALEKGVRSEQALLLAMGIGPDGKRTILGVSVALSEAEAHWRTFLTSLV